MVRSMESGNERTNRFQVRCSQTDDEGRRRWEAASVPALFVVASDADGNVIGYGDVYDCEAGRIERVLRAVDGWSDLQHAFLEVGHRLSIIDDLDAIVGDDIGWRTGVAQQSCQARSTRSLAR